MTDHLSTYQANWNYPTSIRFGVGRIRELGDACVALGVARPLIVTDPGLAESDILTTVREVLDAESLPNRVFSDIKANPTGTNVMDGVAALKSGKHDGVVAVGGGSALDAGKAIALMPGQTRPLWDFEDVGDWWTRVDPDGMVPVVAVPTTAGTGSEVGRASVITDEHARRSTGEPGSRVVWNPGSDDETSHWHKKKIIFHPNMMPGQVICDPALTVSLPPHLTAYTGMDALSHNLEAFCSPFFHPMAEGIALEGMRRIHLSLLRAYREPTDLEARANMMAASTMGATAFQKGLGAMHAVAHAVGALFDTQHGLTNAVVMPYVLERNREAIVDKAERIAGYLNLGARSFEGLLDWVLELRKALAIPHTLKDIGVTEDRLDDLVRLAHEDPSGATNPVPLDEADYRRLIQAALHGTL